MELVAGVFPVAIEAISEQGYRKLKILDIKAIFKRNFGTKLGFIRLFFSK